jgi:hypothetical protein
MKKLRVTYEIITPESAENGEVVERGWIDEEGVDMRPDEYDADDGLTATDLAVNYMLDNMGADGIEASCSGELSERDWWTSYKVDEDLFNGAIENRSFHPVGFTTAEVNEINRKLKEATS